MAEEREEEEAAEEAAEGMVSPYAVAVEAEDAEGAMASNWRGSEADAEEEGGRKERALDEEEVAKREGEGEGEGEAASAHPGCFCCRAKSMTSTPAPTSPSLALFALPPSNPNTKSRLSPSSRSLSARKDCGRPLARCEDAREKEKPTLLGVGVAADVAG